MAWCRPGDKQLPEPMMVKLLTQICVTRPQWVKPVTDQKVVTGIIPWKLKLAKASPSFKNGNKLMDNYIALRISPLSISKGSIYAITCLFQENE